MSLTTVQRYCGACDNSTVLFTLSWFSRCSERIFADVMVHREPHQTDNEVDIISMNETASRIDNGTGGYETLITSSDNTQQRPTSDTSGNFYDVIAELPETYESLQNDEVNNSIQDHSADNPVYLELVDDERNAPDVGEYIHTTTA